jgi:hypothetical protein
VEIATLEFADIVEEAYSPDLNELHIILKDGSFIDVWFSLKVAGRYSYHWDRMAVDGSIYRHDNAPQYDNRGSRSRRLSRMPSV